MASTSQSTGETSLQALLSSLDVLLHEPTYVFLSIPDSQFVAPFPVPLHDIRMFFREAEGVTLIVRQDVAERLELTLNDHQNQYPCRMITCNVHSSLEAVGFMAHLATKLAEKGISVNPVSGYFHDHLFVPVERAEEAVRILEQVKQHAHVVVLSRQ